MKFFKLIILLGMFSFLTKTIEEEKPVKKEDQVKQE